MNIHTFEQLNSTNDYLKQNYQSYNNEDVILAIKQTAGRGRFTRVWESSSDLTFSILFKNSSANHSLITPLSIINALKKLGYNALIKWPNDIYLNSKKLGGILSECIYDGSNILCQIIGIGLNLTPKPESLNAEYVNETRDNLLNNILNEYSNLLNYDDEYLMTEYKKNSFLLGMDINYKGNIYKIVDFTNKLELIAQSGSQKLVLNANEIDIKSMIIK